MSNPMDELNNICAGTRDIETLYSILAKDPDVLRRIDEILPFADTPLHIAASAGNTHVAIEIASLKPSLASKLNHLGLTPLHVALEEKQYHTVRGIIKNNSELIRVKAKGRITPLHYVAERENVDLMAEFLTLCPQSIQDVTMRCETAVHLAVKNVKLNAFKLLFGWLRRNNMEEILNYTDEDGNTVLHIATSTNQDQIVKYLLRTGINPSAKNSSGFTAMDIFIRNAGSLDKKIGEMLSRANAVQGTAVPAHNKVTPAGKYSSDLSFTEEREKYLGIMGKTLKLSPSDVRNVILVVAILIATAAYQAGLSPPGGFWQEDYHPTSNTSGKWKKPHQAGEMIMNPIFLTIFFIFNSLAFYTSVCTIVIVVIGLPYSPILCTSTCCLLVAYYISVATTFPGEVTQGLNLALLILFGISMIAVLWLPLQAIRRALKLKGLVKFVRSHRQICGIDY